MTTSEIRTEAHRLFIINKNKIVPAFYIISCLSFCFQLFQSGLSALIGRIVLVTVAQGYIYLALKTVKEQEKLEITNKDIFIGIRHIFEYLPGYITRMVAIYIPSFILLIPVIVHEYPNIDSYDLLDHIIYFFLSKGINADYISNFLPSINFAGIILILLAFIVYMLLTMLFTFVPFLIEDYDYAWNDALVKSVMMIKDHIPEFIQLVISFLPKIIAYNCISFFLLIGCSLIPYIGYGVYFILVLLSEVLIYLSEYYLSIAIFYSNIRDEKSESYELFHIREF